MIFRPVEVKYPATSQATDEIVINQKLPSPEHEIDNTKQGSKQGKGTFILYQYSTIYKFTSKAIQ